MSKRGLYRKGYLDALRDVSTALLELEKERQTTPRRMIEYIDELVARLEDPEESSESGS